MPRKRTEMGGPAEAAFGRSLKRLRQERGLSQERLSEMSGCDRSYISLLESGINSPSLSMIFQLATALKARPSVLLAEIEEELGWQETGDPPPARHHEP